MPYSCPTMAKTWEGVLWVSTRGPGNGIVSEQRIEKDHGLVNCKMRTSPNRYPIHPNAETKPSFIDPNYIIAFTTFIA
ncbi:hypothetical protein AAES_60759 [Amazona aestiva]|uniref:Uncharacterized protein n=1 Tax=Amazona aestiva TaxID=12930 RepID=A0A0Q3Q5A9_AMAAE|nr:hypothetical protein AAES_60759 [Amazona aestiva]